MNKRKKKFLGLELTFKKNRGIIGRNTHLSKYILTAIKVIKNENIAPYIPVILFDLTSTNTQTDNFEYLRGDESQFKK